MVGCFEVLCRRLPPAEDFVDVRGSLRQIASQSVSLSSMKTPTVIAVGVVCACVAVTAWVSKRRDRPTQWVTAAANASPALKSSFPVEGPATPQSRTAGLTPGTAQWDDARVRDILHREGQPLSDEEVTLFGRIVHRKVSGPDDPVIIERMALAIAGDQAVVASTPPRQAKELKELAVSCLEHPAWRIRRSAIGTCNHNKWLSEQPILTRVQEMAKSDPSMQTRQEAQKALEQLAKMEAFKKAGGTP